MHWAFLAILLCSACTERDPPPPPKAARPKAQVHDVATPVPIGQKIPCTKLFAPEKLSEALGRPLELVDESDKIVDATSVCRFMTVGKPPSQSAQERMYQRNAGVMGVLPGDELCMFTAYCWAYTDVPEMRKRCEEARDTPINDVGDIGCVRQVQAGERFRYVVSTLDPDTRCKFVVNAGPGVTDLPTVKACAQAAVQLIGLENLKP